MADWGSCPNPGPVLAMRLREQAAELVDKTVLSRVL